MYELEPKDYKEAAEEKSAILGTVSIKYGKDAVYQKKTGLKKENRYVFFKASFTNKNVPKKFIVEVEVNFYLFRLFLPKSTVSIFV